MLTNYQTDLSHFSDWQLANGIEYLFNSPMSNYGYEICTIDTGISLEKRVKVILSIKQFYKECYNKRCAHILSHRDEIGGNPLNGFCYMFGDSSAITCRKNYSPEINKAILELLRYILTLDNIACIESGLHWLGHVYHEPFRSEAKKIVDKFIIRYQKQNKVNKKLLDYAHAAAIGYVL